MIRADLLKLHFLASSSNLIDYQVTGSYEIDGAEITRSMRDGNQFSFRIPNSKITAPLPFGDIDEPYFARIYKDGTLMIEGVVNTVTRNFEEVSIDCEDIYYLLTYYTMGEFSQKIFRKAQVIGIIDFILTQTQDSDHGFAHEKLFRIGNFFWCDQLTTVLNFDAREEIRVSALLERLTNSVEGVYFKSGGLRIQEFGATANYLGVDIGTFDSNTGFMYDKYNIKDLQIEKTYELPLYLMFGYGGTYENPAGTQQIISLSNLSTYVGSTDPDYVLSTDHIINQELSADLGHIPNFFSAETLYDDSKPATQVTPSAAERGEAANGVYRAVIQRFKEENKRVPETITIDSDQFPDNIMPGNTVNVNFTHGQQVYDPMSGSVQIIDVPDFRVQGTFYVESYSMNLGLEEKSISLNLSKNPVYGNKEPQKVNRRFFKKMRKNKEYFESVAITTTNVFGLYSYTIGAGLLPDTTVGGNPAKLLTVNKIADATFGDVTSVPTNATPIIDWYWCSDRDNIINLEFVSNPTVGVATFQIAVQVNNNWTALNVANIKLLVKFDV